MENSHRFKLVSAGFTHERGHLYALECIVCGESSSQHFSAEEPQKEATALEEVKNRCQCNSSVDLATLADKQEETKYLS